MAYNFETVGKRYHTGSRKWNELLASGVREDEDIIPFSVADMEFETAPEIVTAIKEEVEHYVLGYANPTREYLDTVCRWMRERHGWDARPEWILPEHGIVDAFFNAVKIFTQPGEGVMLMTPVYYPMYRAVNDNSRVLVDCPLVYKGDRYEIDFADFERKATDENTKLLILCSPHNPIGRVWRRDELEHIAEICLKHHVLVLSDEIHFDLVMPGHKHIVYASLSEEAANNCIVCTAPSKTFNLAGLQTSNIFVPNPALREQYMAGLKRGNPNPKCNILGYRACEAAYKHSAPWLEQAIQVIDTNRKLVADFMAREFPQVQVIDLEATYLLWMNWRGLGLDSRELERINHQEARLFFDEGYIFGAQGDGFERWNLACPTRYIREALERMKTAYKKYVK